ncbi:hypothetical protein AB0D88_32840 [Streptomyces werraensis]
MGSDQFRLRADAGSIALFYLLNLAGGERELGREVLNAGQLALFPAG